MVALQISWQLQRISTTLWDQTLLVGSPGHHLRHATSTCASPQHRGSWTGRRRLLPGSCKPWTRLLPKIAPQQTHTARPRHRQVSALARPQSQVAPEPVLPDTNGNRPQPSPAAKNTLNGSRPQQLPIEKNTTSRDTAERAGLLDLAKKLPTATTPHPLPLGHVRTVTRPLPHVLVLHLGGTLGMSESSYTSDIEGNVSLKVGTGGKFSQGLRPGAMLANLLTAIPELSVLANLELQVVFNRDSCRVGPKDWIQIAKILDKNRDKYDAFLIVHGTDTMAYTASALSLMLAGFKRPIVMTGSQLPLLMPRSDARQNLVDSLTCATAFIYPPHVHLEEVAICFGGKLMRGNRAQKVNSSSYQAFDSPTYPPLATMGVDVLWNTKYLLKVHGSYRPRFKLDPHVIRIPIVPGSDPRQAYGDLSKRGVKGIVLEAFGVGNMPDTQQHGWIPWLRQQRKAGLMVYLSSQCVTGPLHPELYISGSIALKMGVEAGPAMTPECAVVKVMQCLSYPDIPLGVPLAGEM